MSSETQEEHVKGDVTRARVIQIQNGTRVSHNLETKTFGKEML